LVPFNNAGVHWHYDAVMITVYNSTSKKTFCVVLTINYPVLLCFTLSGPAYSGIVERILRIVGREANSGPKKTGARTCPSAGPQELAKLGSLDIDDRKVPEKVTGRMWERFIRKIWYCDADNVLGFIKN